MATTVLVAGGLGYIGSHTSVELINKGFNVIIADNLSNSELFVLGRIEQITGIKPIFYQVDLTNKISTSQIFEQHSIDVVIHFAAYKSVFESVKEPLKYYHNNLFSLLNVLECMAERRVDKMIFSSSATVYGQPEKLPVTEETPFQKALSSYGSTKQMGEEMLEKTASTQQLKAISLRYFNPVGAHASALIGELPKGVPNNLFPYVMQTGSGRLQQLTVYGNDYQTPDGTCLRDYIHVVDLAKAHVVACERLIQKRNESSYEVFNIGTGQPTSVLDIINAFEKTVELKLNYKIGVRRDGDAAVVYADTTKANTVLGWKAKLGLDEMIRSSWEWELGKLH